MKCRKYVQFSSVDMKKNNESGFVKFQPLISYQRQTVHVVVGIKIQTTGIDHWLSVDLKCE